MTKYNVGDVLEITEDFTLEYAMFSEGEKYTVNEIFGASGADFYELEDAANGYLYHNTISEVDAHSGFSKVEPKVEFKVGDKVRLLEGAHGNPDFGYFWSTEEGFEKNYGYRYVLAEPFVIRVEIDYAGEVGISQDGLNSYVLSEFLVPWVEEEKPAEHMEIGKSYQSILNELYYRVDQFDFYNSQVLCTYGHEPDVGQNLKTERNFFEIEEEFGVLPPVKPENEYTTVTAEEFRKEVQEAKAEALEESKANYVEIDPKLEVPETVSVDALREAWDFVDHEYPDIEKLIKLAKRLS